MRCPLLLGIRAKFYCTWLFGGDCGGRGGGASLSGFGLSSLAESVVEFTVDDLHMAKTASSGRTTTDGLLRPLIGSLPLAGISARSTLMLLNMVAAFSAPTAQSVRLVVLLSETRRSFRHDETKRAFGCRLGDYVNKEN